MYMVRYSIIGIVNSYYSNKKGSLSHETSTARRNKAKKYSCTVGWSDLALFEIVENGHIAVDHVHFLGVQFLKSASFLY